MNKKRIEAIYNETTKITNNFREINPHIISKRPHTLLTFRLILNMSQWQFAKLINKSQGTVYMIENNMRKSVDEKVIQRVLSKIKRIRQVPEKKILIERYSKIANRGTFRDSIYAKRMSLMASKERSIKGAILNAPTKQEKAFIDMLQDKNIPYKFHAVIVASRKFVVDFLFPSDENPRLVIEMKQLNLNYRKRLQAIELAYRAIKIHQKYPNIKLIAILEGNIPEEVINILKEDYDHVFVNVPFKNIIKLLNLGS